MAKSTSISVPKPRQLKSGSWFIQLRLDGVSTPITAATENECISTAMQIKAAHKAGQKVTKAKGGDKTLTQAIDDYISARSNTLSPETIRGYRIIQRNRFKSVMDKKIKDIDNWQKIVNDEAKKLSGKTIINSWYLVTPILRENKCPVPDVTLPQVVKDEHLFLEPEQIPIFIKSMHGKSGEIAALLALSSLRSSELCALTWENVDLKKGLIYVKGAMVRNEKNKFVPKDTNKNTTSRRTVPIMIPELSAAFKAVEDKTGNVVKIRPNTIYRQVNAACKDNGFLLVGVHGLRHSFASLGYHLKMSVREVMDIGGWSDYNTVQKIYTHLAKTDKAKAANVMSEFYKNANKNANVDKKASIINAYTVD